MEMLRAGIAQQNPFKLFPGAFTSGEQIVPINGLIWMGNKSEMRARIREKLDQGWKCLKLKVGALDFDTECGILSEIRGEYSPTDLMIRLDANGAFTPDQALEKLKILSAFEIHSIEQPIRPGQWENMAGLCEQSPIPIALDEELIGVHSYSDKKNLLEQIKPTFVVLKPTLHGGFRACDHWIDLAQESGTGWWATSYLESDIGLNAIAQWVGSRAVPGVYQGLGTGSLYTNNLPSPLVSSARGLRLDLHKSWDLRALGI
jgi:L-alanine-DL-glutamate epimerase-like enolase superfamily enzyme